MINSKLVLSGVLLYSSIAIYGMDDNYRSTTPSPTFVRVQSPQSLKKKHPSLMMVQDDFCVVMDGKIQKIPSENTRNCKGITSSNLSKFTKNGGYFWLDSNKNGDLFLEGKVRGEGGGFLVGEVAYWGTKGALIAAYGAKCYFSGGWALAELPEVLHLIEGASQAARFAGQVTNPY